MAEGSKRCWACGLERPLTDFSKDSTRADKRQPICKPCGRARAKLRQQRFTVTEKLCRGCSEIKAADAFAKNIRSIDGLQNRCRSCCAAYLAKRRLDQAFVIAERDRVLRWHRGHPGVHLIAQWRYRARRGGATIIEFTIEQLAERMSMFNGCWMCGGPSDQIDHVKPLSKGGIHCLSNLRPACVVCNRNKSHRWPYH